MAMSIVDNAVSISRGRGAAKVTLSVTFDALEKWAKKNKIDTAKLMKRSFGRACSGLKKKFYGVIRNRGGECGVPKFKDFEEFTKTLRDLSGRSSRPMGGMLADRGSVVAFKRNGYQVIGWPDYLAETSRKFQEGIGGSTAEKWFVDADYRRVWHRQGVRSIPRAYVHNPRMIIPEPFGNYVEDHLEEWARGAFYKELAKQMQKGGAL